MKSRAGIIYELENGEYGLAIYAEQHPSFKKIKKVCLHHFQDIHCTKAVTNEEGKKLIGLVSISKLRVVGFTD